MMYKVISFISIVVLMQVRTVVIGCNVTLGTISCTCEADTMLCSGLQTESSDLISAIVNTSMAHYSSVHLKHVVINVENLSLSFDSSLEEMELQNLTLNSDLITLPDSLFSGVTESLISLDLRNNSFSSIPGNALKDLHQLQTLDLSDNLIIMLTRNDFDGLKNLTVLKLERNSIRSIEGEAFSSLQNLEDLSLKANDIQKLGITVFDNVPNLKFLSLASNQLQVIEPKTFMELPVLHTLMLDHNSFSSLKDINFSSSSLFELSATYCSFEGSIMHDDLQHLSGLEVLDLSFNNLTLIKKSAFTSLQHLKHLNVSHNRVRVLEGYSFANLISLKELDLSHNVLFIIKTDAFRNSTKLVSLDLSHNKLGALICEYTSDLLALEQINLQNNELKTIKPGTFLYSLHMKNIKLQGNILDCNCMLSEFAQYLRDSPTINKTDITSITCSSPPSSARMPITDIDYDAWNCTISTICSSPSLAVMEDDASTIETPVTTQITELNTLTTSVTPENVSDFTSAAVTSPLTIEPSTDDSSITNKSMLSIVPITTSSVTTAMSTLETIIGINVSLVATPTDVSTLATTNTSEILIPTTSSKYLKDSVSTTELLPTLEAKDDMEIVIKAHSYSDGNLCLEWVVNGDLPSQRLRCILYYTYPTPNPPSPAHNVTQKKTDYKCPTMNNEVQNECKGIIKVDKLHQFCMKIYKHSSRELLVDSCITPTEKQSTDNSSLAVTEMITIVSSYNDTNSPSLPTTSTTPVITSVPLVITTIDTSNETKPALSPVNITATDFTTNATSTPVITSLVTTTTTTIDTSNETKPALSPVNITATDFTTNATTTPVITSFPIVTTTTIDTSNETEPALSPVNITYINFSLGNDSVFKVNWKVNREEPQSVCYLVLRTSPESPHHKSWSKSDIPCMNNTEIIPLLETEGNYTVCLIVLQLNFDNIRFCSTVHIPSKENVSGQSEATTSTPAATNFTTNTTTATIITSQQTDTTTAIPNTTNNTELELKPFKITYLNHSSINNSAIMVNWKLSRKESRSTCSLMLTINPEESNYKSWSSSDMPCTDNSKVVPLLEKGLDYKICLTAIRMNFDNISVCYTVHTPSPKFSTSPQSESSFWSLPKIVLIGLLVVVILIVILLATRTILRKPAVSETYNVSKEENRVQRREKRLSNTPSLRYSYTPREPSFETFKV